MIRPFKDVQPGDALSASELNRANAEHERNAVSEVVAPLEQSFGTTGRVVRLNTRPSIWVKITGKLLCSDDPDNCDSDDDTCGFCGSGDPCTFPEFHYSGVEQLEDQCDSGSDNDGGMRFYVDTFPLKELSGDTGITIGAIVRAYPSNNGPYYVFAGGGGSGGTKMIRITGPFYKDPGGRMPWASPSCYYPGIIQKANAQNGWTDTSQQCWLMLWKNFNFATHVPVSAGEPYTAVLANGTAAHLGIDLGFSYNPQKVEGEEIIQGANLPVYGSDSYSAAWAVQCVTDDSGASSTQPVDGG